MTGENRQRQKLITFPISVPSQLGDVHADTRLLCRGRGWRAHGGAPLGRIELGEVRQ